MGTLVVARGLRKSFGSVVAVDGISFQVEEGEVFGILGPNGAGKTTTIRMVAGLSPPSGGELLVDGLDVSRHGRRIRARLGLVPQHDNLDPELTVRQNLLVYSRYFDLPRKLAEERIEEVLQLFHLKERENARIDSLSGGLRRRLIIARALINAPRLLILDEPTAGLDPQARHLVWQKLRQLQSQGITMLLTTHYMEEAEQLCDRLIILHQGRILAEGSPRELIEAYAGREVVEVRSPTPKERTYLCALAARTGGVEVEETEDVVYLYLRRPDGLDPSAMRGMGMQVVYRRANLEDVFLRLTGRALVE
jgi:lipooligosaccharide transport system ATP-binding protein